MSRFTTTKFSTLVFASRRALKRLWTDRRGVGAVEFAIIFPILLALYITAFELTIGFSVYKRATHAAGTIADLVSQQASVNEAYLGTMEDVAAAIFVPYATTGLKLKISAITIDANKKATISWSWDQDDGRPYAPGTAAAVPADLLQPNGFLIHAEIAIPHKLLMFMSNLSSTITPITIGRDYYFAKREDSAITCSNC